MIYVFVKRLKLPKTTTTEEVGHCFRITGRTVMRLYGLMTVVYNYYYDNLPTSKPI